MEATEFCEVYSMPFISKFCLHWYFEVGAFQGVKHGETIKATHPMHFFMRTAETPEARFRHFAALDVKNLRFFVDATLVDATFGK